jgi:hypothetical protein
MGWLVLYEAGTLGVQVGDNSFDPPLHLVYPVVLDWSWIGQGYEACALLLTGDTGRGHGICRD